MEFNKAYNRNEFVKFLKTDFLPEDFVQEETPLVNPKQFQYTQQVTRLGECRSLELVVFEVLHSSVSDARVGLTKEAFRMLFNELCERALVFFVPQDDNSNYRFSLIEITLEQKEGSAKIQRTYSNPHRYSYYLGEGISYHTPNKYLNEAGRVVSIEDLRNRFSVEVLTKAFYQELSDWYAWAVKVVHFPNAVDDDNDNEAYNSEAMIRLITRLIFVWFIKQRHLVPDEFFDERYISDHLLKSFTPNAETTLFGKADNSYYLKGIIKWKYNDIDYYNFETREQDLSNPFINATPMLNKFLNGLTRLHINIAEEIFLKNCMVSGTPLNDYWCGIKVSSLI